jgi:hypothetical protein
MATNEQPKGKRKPVFGKLPRDEWILRMHRSALASAAYHANSEPVHDKAPYQLKPMSLPEILQHFDKHPDRVLQEHVAAWLLDHPGRAPLFDYAVDRLVGAADAMRARAALAMDSGRVLQRSVRWRTTKPPDGDQGPVMLGPTRFSVARDELARSRHGLPPGGSPTAPGGGPTGGGGGQAPAPGDGQNPPAGSAGVSSRKTRQAQPPTAAGLFGPRSVGAGQIVPPACVASGFHCQVDFDPETQITRCNAEVDVNRPPGEFDVIADPQNWSEAAYLFFQMSQRCSFSDGAFPALPNPPPPGTVPFVGPLHENVSFSFNPLYPMRGNNVLDANYAQFGAGESRLNVSLCVSLSTAIGPSVADGGLDIDRGGFEALVGPTPDTTHISGEKVVRFTSRELCGWDLGPWLNLFAPLWIAPFLGFMIYESACA